MASIKTIIAQLTQLENLQNEAQLSYKQCKVVKGPQNEKLKSMLKLVQVQQSIVMKELVKIKGLISAQDETIKSLGTKLCDYTNKNSEPFYVSSKEKSAPNLYRPDTDSHWSRARAFSAQQEMLHEMARLSIQPMGLSKSEQMKVAKEVAKTMFSEKFKYDAKMEACDAESPLAETPIEADCPEYGI